MPLYSLTYNKVKRTECRFGALTLCINIGILYLKLFNHPDRQRCIDAEVSYISETEFRIGRVRSYFYVNLLQILRGCHIAGSFYFAHDNIINDLLIQIQAHRPKGIEICQICSHAGDKANVDICVEQIRDTIKSIRDTSKTKKELLLVTSFFDNIDDIEETVKKLYDTYKMSKNFLDNNRNIVTEEELEELRKKIENADGTRKELFQGIYDNKKKTYEEIENIKGALKESLLNLQYILSNLQQIEVTINSVSVSNNTYRRDIRQVSDTLEVFSEELKGSLKKLRL